MIYGDRDRDDQDDDTLDLTEDQIIDDDQDAGSDDEDAGGDDIDATDPDGDGDGEEETVIGFDDADEDADKEGDSSVIRSLRRQLRESKTTIREMQAKTPVAEPIKVGPKPTLADCNYDEEAYETALDTWKADKAKVEEQTAAVEQENRQAQEAWNADLNRYAEQKAKIGVPDYEDAESIVISALNPMQQAVIVKAADNPAAFAYALSKSPSKLTELAKQQDPIKLAVAVAKMEGAVKVVKRKKGPAIDKPVSGSGSMPGGTDKQLEKLEKEAERTGNRTDLINYRKKLEARGKKK
jgi:hypothetical protein